jgi:hypothetical protein
MKILDLFSGTGSATKIWKDEGYEVISVEINDSQEATINCDLMELNGYDLAIVFGKFDFIWASPPCTTFSVASIGKHWDLDGFPKTEECRKNMRLLRRTLEIIKICKPKYWVIENPRGMMRKVMQEYQNEGFIHFNRYEITQCQYGHSNMKPTDLFGCLPPYFDARKCKNGSSCHEAAPRGSKTGTQGIKDRVERSMIPYDLTSEIYHSIMR